MKRFVLLFLTLLLAACAAVSTSQTEVPGTGAATATSPAGNLPTAMVESNSLPTEENSLAGSAELPERIELRGGATSAQRSVLLPSGAAVKKEYVVTIHARQTMAVDVLSEDVPLGMTITLPNGLQVMPELSAAEGGGYGIGHEFLQAESGDYLITLTKADDTPSTSYTAYFQVE